MMQYIYHILFYQIINSLSIVLSHSTMKLVLVHTINIMIILFLRTFSVIVSYPFPHITHYFFHGSVIFSLKISFKFISFYILNSNKILIPVIQWLYFAVYNICLSFNVLLSINLAISFLVFMFLHLPFPCL